MTKLSRCHGDFSWWIDYYVQFCYVVQSFPFWDEILYILVKGVYSFIKFLTRSKEVKFIFNFDGTKFANALFSWSFVISPTFNF